MRPAVVLPLVEDVFFGGGNQGRCLVCLAADRGSRFPRGIAFRIASRTLAVASASARNCVWLDAWTEKGVFGKKVGGVGRGEGTMAVHYLRTKSETDDMKRIPTAGMAVRSGTLSGVGSSGAEVEREGVSGEESGLGRKPPWTAKRGRKGNSQDRRATFLVANTEVRPALGRFSGMQMAFVCAAIWFGTADTRFCEVAVVKQPNQGWEKPLSCCPAHHTCPARSIVRCVGVCPSAAWWEMI